MAVSCSRFTSFVAVAFGHSNAISLGAEILDVLGPPLEAVEQPFCIEIGTSGSFIFSYHELRVKVAAF